jgi:hypothetical protein
MHCLRRWSTIIFALPPVFALAACGQDTGNTLGDAAVDAQDADGGATVDSDASGDLDDGADGDDTTVFDRDDPDGDGSGEDSGLDDGQDGDRSSGDLIADGSADGNPDGGPDEGPDGGDDDPGCAGYAEGVSAGNVDNVLLYELSGIVASRRNPGVLWTHNDGSNPKLFAIDTNGHYLGQYNLVDLVTHDWEDIALGPGPDPGLTYVYVGDHGNNGRDRQRVWVHRIPEPDLDGVEVPFNIDLAGGETIPLDYPDARHDVECLLVDPQNGDVYLVTKAYEGPTILFRAAAPLVDGQALTLEQMNTIDLGSTPNVNLATGGDVNAAGDRIVIRIKLSAYVWNRPTGTPFWEAFDGPACIVPLKLELTGEAAGFAADGASFYTTSEWLNPPLYFYEYIR